MNGQCSPRLRFYLTPVGLCYKTKDNIIYCFGRGPGGEEAALKAVARKGCRFESCLFRSIFFSWGQISEANLNRERLEPLSKLFFEMAEPFLDLLECFGVSAFCRDKRKESRMILLEPGEQIHLVIIQEGQIQQNVLMGKMGFEKIRAFVK